MSDITRAYLDETRWHRTTVSNYLNRGLPYYGDGDGWMHDYRRMMRRLRQLAEPGRVVGAHDDRGRECWVWVDALSSEEMHHLAVEGTDTERRAVAGCTSTPRRDLDHLAGDSDARVRQAVAGNPSCSPEAAVSLLGDDDERVREAARTNPALPEVYRVLLMLVA